MIDEIHSRNEFIDQEYILPDVQYKFRKKKNALQPFY